MERADRPCDRPLPIVITGVKEGLVRLEQSADHGGIVGCERTFELTSSGSQLSGTLKNPSGGIYGVKATKQ